MILLSVHYHRVHGEHPPPTHRAQLRLQNANLLERKGRHQLILSVSNHSSMYISSQFQAEAKVKMLD